MQQPKPHLDLASLAEIKRSDVQVRLISTALDEDLLPPAEARKLLTWSDLDMGVKLLVALQLMENGEFQNKAMLHEALNARRLARRGLAALMLHQLGDEAGTKALQEINQSQDPLRDAARLMMVNAAMRRKLHRAASWAYAVTTEKDVPDKLRDAALQAAMRFGHPQAARLWQQRFEASHDLVRRTQLGLMALQDSPWLETSLFDAMAKAAHKPIIQQMAEVGQAITADRDDVPDQVVALVRLNHPVVNTWALSFARDHAKTSNAQLILLGIVLAYDQGPEAGKLQRLDNAVQATRLLFAKDPRVASNLLHPILASKKTDPLLVRGILLGLVNSDAPQPQRVLEGLPPFDDKNSEHLALLLRAKHESKLSDEQLRDLALLARGGGGLQDTWRIQAAWAWLKQTGHTDTPLRRALEHLP